MMMLPGRNALNVLMMVRTRELCFDFQVTLGEMVLYRKW